MSQEGESESHASRAVEGEALVATGQEVLLKQLADTFRQIAGVIPQASVGVDRERKSPLERLRKYGAKEFRASKDDSPEIAKGFLLSANSSRIWTPRENSSGLVAFPLKSIFRPPCTAVVR
ncbi:hypothetical protein JCGZ_24382 [Jatropha curcas]|uniref:Uncharacterized protein n=1 Tax=Jatropha curcas TaxID=180498 RepID=A0A067L5V9_JATCU|nr:hypothetical protein JCGZ_24382 [Jatropha curcas]